MPEVNAKSLDRLLAGEVSHAEQRRLAQEALDDPDLFDALTAAALTKAVLDTPIAADAAAGVPVRRQRPRTAILAMLSAAAAVILAVAYGWTRSSDRPVTPAPGATSPVLVAPPVLLTARAETITDQTFRTEAVPGRLPKDTGTIVSVEDRVAVVDLGALDGLKQDMELHIRRGDRRVGSVTMTAVFRERARGRVRSGDVRQGDRVEIDPAVTVNAILDQAMARRAAGDRPGALDLAARAVSREDVAAVPTASAELLNELGVVQIERRDYAVAERTLQLAQSVAVGPTRMRVANNRGAVAALRGDRDAARAFYRSAASLAGDSPDLAGDRQAIEKNLAAVHTAR